MCLDVNYTIWLIEKCDWYAENSKTLGHSTIFAWFSPVENYLILKKNTYFSFSNVFFWKNITGRHIFWLIMSFITPFKYKNTRKRVYFNEHLHTKWNMWTNMQFGLKLQAKWKKNITFLFVYQGRCFFHQSCGP